MIFKKEQSKPQYFLTDSDHERQLALALAEEIHRRKKDTDTLILLCIGTDKITGDCLGPLVGTKLREQGYPHPVHGTLQYPVHAVNLPATLVSLHQKYASPFLLVIDAAVGPADKIGCVSFSRSSIRPGRGVRRPLSPVGDLALTGIISEASETCVDDLPYTRLFVVNALAEFICRVVMQGVR
ncbi:MAG TPA: spore protease YyaC [Candidatus Anaerobutyricum avicola]|nr:spore protease YyaC [Candidatus Anaerobutyricum avicola]